MTERRLDDELMDVYDSFKIKGGACVQLPWKLIDQAPDLLTLICADVDADERCGFTEEDPVFFRMCIAPPHPDNIQHFGFGVTFGAEGMSL